MTHCKKCGKELTNAKSKCPYCGEDCSVFSAPGGDNTAVYKRRKIAVFIIVIAILAACGAVFAVLYNRNPENVLARANRYLSEQNYEQAIGEYQRFIEIDPNNAAAYSDLADAYVGVEQSNKAIETLKTGLDETNNEELSSKLVELLSESAHKQFDENNYEQAILEFERIVEIDRRNTLAYAGIADSYAALGNTDGVIKTLKTALEATSDESIKTKLVDLLLESANTSLSDNNYEQATSVFEQVLEIDGKNINAYVGLADSYINHAGTDKAVEALKTGFENTGDESIKDKLVILLSDCANQYISKKDYGKAAERYAEVIAVDVKNTDAYISLAESYTAMNNTDKAIETLEAGFKETSDSIIEDKLVNLLTQSANRVLSEKKYEQALAMFEKLMNVDLKNADAYIGAAKAHIGKEQNDAALKVLQDGYDKTNDSRIKKMLVKRLLISAADLTAEQSIMVFRKVLELDELQKTAYTSLANAYTELTQEDKAIEILQTGYEKTGDADIKNMLNELTYDIESVSAVMYTTTDISVRTEPDISSEKVGGLEKDDAVTVTGKANNGWYRISFKDGEYFVNSEYLSLSKPVEPPPVDSTPAEQQPVEQAPAANSIEALLNSVTLNPQKTGDKLLDPLVESILARITNSNMSTYEKVKACYDYAINNFSYGQGSGNGWGIKGWAYDVLTSNVGVCNNYSSAFAVMTRSIGLEAYLQNGQTSSSKGGFTGHTWCTIMINGVPYLFDPQVEDNIAKGGAIYYYKFCKPYDSGTAVENYILSGNRYYLENEKDVNGYLLIEPDGTMVTPDGTSNIGWWSLFF